MHGSFVLLCRFDSVARLFDQHVAGTLEKALAFHFAAVWRWMCVDLGLGSHVRGLLEELRDEGDVERRLSKFDDAGFLNACLALVMTD